MRTTVACLTLAAVADAHGRWKCPAARDELTEDGTHDKFENTANKVRLEARAYKLR
jgi:hypothetical protein